MTSKDMRTIVPGEIASILKRYWLASYRNARGEMVWNECTKDGMLLPAKEDGSTRRVWCATEVNILKGYGA